MIIMDKFEKRVIKSSKNTNNALVVGLGFENLEKILSIYNTVFVINETRPEVKARNLVYRENFQNLNFITEVDAIFLDLDKVSCLDELKDFWQRNKSVILIEGNDPIGREYSKPLYDTGWRCTNLHGSFHVWEQIQ